MEAVPKAEELMAKSDLAFRSDDFDEAYSLARRALAAQKEGCANHRCGYVAEILLRMGAALDAMGRYEEAYTLFVESEEIAKGVEEKGWLLNTGATNGALGSLRSDPKNPHKSSRIWIYLIESHTQTPTCPTRKLPFFTLKFRPFHSASEPTSFKPLFHLD